MLHDTNAKLFGQLLVDLRHDQDTDDGFHELSLLVSSWWSAVQHYLPGQGQRRTADEEPIVEGGQGVLLAQTGPFRLVILRRLSCLEGGIGDLQCKEGVSNISGPGITEALRSELHSVRETFVKTGLSQKFYPNGGECGILLLQHLLQARGVLEQHFGSDTQSFLH